MARDFDEVTITGSTHVAELADGKVSTFDITPEEFGFEVRDEASIAGGDAEVNAAALREVLSGKPSAYRDMVIMNAACSLMIADKAADLVSGAELAKKSIDDGQAMDTLEKLVRVSNQGAPQ